ncbi:hypothetical protein ACWEQ7_37530, partial [Streptomyces sp. NPDC004069]
HQREQRDGNLGPRGLYRAQRMRGTQPEPGTARYADVGEGGGTHHQFPATQTIKEPTQAQNGQTSQRTGHA